VSAVRIRRRHNLDSGFVRRIHSGPVLRLGLGTHLHMLPLHGVVIVLLCGDEPLKRNENDSNSTAELTIHGSSIN
jgi:hypothetical protein